MATNSYVGYKTKKGNYKIIYIHFDGYPYGIGKVLLKKINTKKKAKKLIKEGHVLWILGEPYGTEYKEYISKGQISKNPAIKFTYLFEDDRWTFSERTHGSSEHRDYRDLESFLKLQDLKLQNYKNKE